MTKYYVNDMVKESTLKSNTTTLIIVRFTWYGFAGFPQNLSNKNAVIEYARFKHKYTYIEKRKTHNQLLLTHLNRAYSPGWGS